MKNKQPQLGLRKPATIAACAAALGLVACEDGQTEPRGSAAALEVECVGSDAAVPSDAWMCPQDLTVECTDGSGTANPETIFVRADGDSCNAPVTVDHGPFAVGDHVVVVRDADSNTLCRADLHVVDTAAPTVTTKTLFMWPPNHKFHSFAVEDCASVQDACRTDLQAEFVWASSDEPVDDIGDGHHAPDILLDADCKHVQLRSERQGPKDGRVYKLGVRVVDGSGNATEGVCTVIVDHDQRGVDGADSSEAYRVTFDGTGGQPSCDGANPNPPTGGGEPDAGTPPVKEPPVEKPPVEDPPVVID
ncbi:MAG: hypothetical protein QM778_14655 [Myxococcales bacterium]